MKKVIAYILLAGVVIGGGCVGTLSEEFTPGRVDKEVVAYNEEAGTGSAEDYRGFLYPSLASVKRLKADFEAAVVVTNQELKHLAEQKQLQAEILKGIVTIDFDTAVTREDFLFNPTTGVLAMGLGLLGIGAGGYLGLMRKRPQDITPVEMEKALGDVRGEVTAKDRQLINLVGSVRNVLLAQDANGRDNTDVRAILKSSQTPETREAVKKALAQL
jgi:hypothetical protein